MKHDRASAQIASEEMFAFWPKCDKKRATRAGATLTKQEYCFIYTWRGVAWLSCFIFHFKRTPWRNAVELGSENDLWYSILLWFLPLLRLLLLLCMCVCCICLPPIIIFVNRKIPFLHLFRWEQNGERWCKQHIPFRFRDWIFFSCARLQAHTHTHDVRCEHYTDNKIHLFNICIIIQIGFDKRWATTHIWRWVCVHVNERQLRGAVGSDGGGLKFQSWKMLLNYVGVCLYDEEMEFEKCAPCT